MVMPLRIAAGTVSPAGVAGSLAGTPALAAAVLWCGARLYRGRITRTGSRIGLRQALARTG
jgi:hypothetical protein